MTLFYIKNKQKIFIICLHFNIWLNNSTLNKQYLNKCKQKSKELFRAYYLLIQNISFLCFLSHNNFFNYNL